MTPQQKLIEYYFYHFSEFDFTTIKSLLQFQKTMFPQKMAYYAKKPWKRLPSDSTAVFMCHIIVNTYQHFTGAKRELLNMRYFKKCDRYETCKQFKISKRTYHRHLAQMLSYAEEYISELHCEQLEYQKQVKFFADLDSRNITSNDYLQNYSIG